MLLVFALISIYIYIYIFYIFFLYLHYIYIYIYKYKYIYKYIYICIYIQQKNLNPLLNLFINCISARSAPWILSIEGECTFLLLNFPIIGLCNSSANYLIESIKNHTNVKKVGHTSEFPFTIHWWILKIPKNQAFEKMIKIVGDTIILHMCTKIHNHMTYSSWDMDWDMFCHFGPFSELLLPPPLPP